MPYLVAAAQQRDIQAVRATTPALWRQVRRFNLPVQLALAAGHACAAQADDPARLALVSLTPCQTGSSDLYQWVHRLVTSAHEGRIGTFRVNPTHTMHVVDNLALSALAIMHGVRGYGLGLGGAAGQAWNGIEVVRERLLDGHEAEALLIAGDQERSDGGSGLGIALLFAREPRPFPSLDRFVRLLAVERRRLARPAVVRPHAADGLAAFLAALEQHRGQGLAYPVPPEHGDGIDQVTVIMELS